LRFVCYYQAEEDMETTSSVSEVHGILTKQEEKDG
jgi:hypothetical protein